MFSIVVRFKVTNQRCEQVNVPIAIMTMPDLRGRIRNQLLVSGGVLSGIFKLTERSKQ